jgi:uncharacterized protein
MASTGEGRQTDHPLFPRERSKRRRSRTQNSNDSGTRLRRFLSQQPRLWRIRWTGTEKDNIADAIATYDHLIELGMPASKIVAYGESLGSGQAVRLGAARPVAAVVLEAPLTSTIDVARSTYFWLPLGLLITDKYNNELNIRLVKAPVLFLHGVQDGVIPVEMGWRVYRAANEPKRIELFPQGTHDDLFDQGAWEKTQAFVDSLSGGR